MRCPPKILSLCLLLLAFPTARPVCGQDAPPSEMELIERVSELQDQLDHEQVKQRDAAEQELIQLGPFALDHLDQASEDMPLDKVERLARVRTALETLAIRAASQPSSVTLKGSLSVEASLQQIRTQTNNDVALSDNAPIDSGSATIDWKNETLSFWDAIKKIHLETGLAIDPYAADGSKLRLAPTDSATAAFMRQNPAVDANADMFQVRVTRVDAARNLTHPNLDYVSLQLLIRWEPRLRPITLKMPADQIEGIDSNGQPVSIRNRQAVFSAMIQPQIPEIQLTIPLKSIPRNVEQLKSLSASIEATLPGRTETFRFKRVGKLPAGKKIDRGGATVTLEGIDKNEDLYGITLSLEFDEELNALESHQAWVFDNSVWLEDPQGQKATPLTYESIRQDNTSVAIAYYFADAPGDRTLVYQTPAAILETQSKVDLKNIPLP